MLSSYTCFGKNHLHFEELESTNAYAAELLSKTSPMDGTAITADNQWGGRGQYDRKWLSEPHKNLTVSLIVYPSFLHISDQFYLSMAVALGIIDYVEAKLCRTAHIKWPNDIYVGDDKLGGILIVNQLQGSTLSSSILGIGLNINQNHFPEEVPNGTSFQRITGAQFDLHDELIQLCIHLEKRYNTDLRHKSHLGLHQAYEQKLYKKGENIQFMDSNSTNWCTGTIEGVSPEGFLLIRAREGTLRKFSLGEVIIKY
ncbi:MAG: biotin--[acetyl-CoA-carboxylase] ligase [Saprospiraceae bacterium]|nr:biotin--[acetyl-CoA-carboxylase] ligase [Saprospiraceae bacterium]